MKFENIKKADDLKSFLNNLGSIKNSEFFHHYTTADALDKIKESGYWHLGNPHGMNDIMELRVYPERNWDKLFFSSFTIEEKENIGMWSMYSQPLTSGVIISIPKECVKNWLKNTKVIYKVLKKNDSFEVLENEPLSKDYFELKLLKVAYANENNGTLEELHCGRGKNTKLKTISDSILTGYIKSISWSYEREVRLMAILKEEQQYCDRLAIKLQEDFFNSIKIIKSPIFHKANTILQNHNHIENSEFINKIRIKNLYDKETIIKKLKGITSVTDIQNLEKIIDREF